MTDEVAPDNGWRRWWSPRSGCICRELRALAVRFLSVSWVGGEGRETETDSQSCNALPQPSKRTWPCAEARQGDLGLSSGLAPISSHEIAAHIGVFPGRNACSATLVQRDAFRSTWSMGCPSRLRHTWEVQYSPSTDALSRCMRSQGAAERSAQCRVARAVRHLESARLEKTESVRNIAPGGVSLSCISRFCNAGSESMVVRYDSESGSLGSSNGSTEDVIWRLLAQLTPPCEALSPLRPSI